MLKIYIVKINLQVMHLTIDSDIPYIHGVFEAYATVQYIKGSEIDNHAIRLSDALIIRTRTQCNKELLNDTSVKVIATATIGTDHIDLDYCQQHNIEVRNAEGCNSRGVLQWVAAVLRHITLSDNKRPNDYTLGIVGVGNVGSLVSTYARHWGFNVMECDPPRKEREGGEFYPIEELAQRCDILTFHTPLDHTTHHLVDAQLLSMMRPETIIINASRGGVVDNSALAKSSHRYYFDVWENEPDIDPEVLTRATLATPHVAGYSAQGKANATAIVVNAIAQHFGLTIANWYPTNIERTTPQLINWMEMCRTIDKYYPISEESQQLKSHPELFETLRNSYVYRQEYF